MINKMKFRCLYMFMQAKENDAMRNFFHGSRQFGPQAMEFTKGFCDARKARESEFSVDARMLFQRSLSLSPEFTRYVEDFVVEKPWLIVPTDDDLEEIYDSLSWREKMKMLLN